MTHAATLSPAASVVVPGNPARRTAAVLLFLQFAAMWGAFFILAPAINWPASLDLPPAEILPLIRDQASAVFTGYLSYLIHALLLIPIAALMPKALGLGDVSGRTALLLGGLAGFAKALGITRWIFLMPGLAIAYTAVGVDPATQAAIGVVYRAFNTYAGGVGEILGVGLFAGLWTLVMSSALIASGSRILGGAGVVAALMLFTTLPSVVGIENPILLTLSGIVWQLWTFALAVQLWRRA
jgi:hypothetical protein